MKKDLIRTLNMFVVAGLAAAAPASANDLLNFSQASCKMSLVRQATSIAYMSATAPISTDLPKLSANDTPDQIEKSLHTALTGRTRAEIMPILEKMGARNVALYDFRKTGLAEGTDLGDGYKAGDPLLTIIFGLARPGIQPDRRIRIYLQYKSDKHQPEQNDQVQKLLAVECYEK